MDEQKRGRGRPAGSGELVAAVERTRQSRRNRTPQGATKLDFYLDPVHADQLAQLMQHWDLDTRKQAVQRALDILHQTITKNQKAA